MPRNIYGMCKYRGEIGKCLSIKLTPVYFMSNSSYTVLFMQTTNGIYKPVLSVVAEMLINLRQHLRTQLFTHAHAHAHAHAPNTIKITKCFLYVRMSCAHKQWQDNVPIGVFQICLIPLSIHASMQLFSMPDMLHSIPTKCYLKFQISRISR